MTLAELKLNEFTVSPQTKAVAKQVAITAGVVGLFLVANTAMAAGGFDVDATGQKAQTFIQTVVKWLVIIAGAIGAGVLLFKFVQAWNGHLDWMDFIKFALFYAAAGSTSAIAATLFGAFG